MRAKLFVREGKAWPANTGWRFLPLAGR